VTSSASAFTYRLNRNLGTVVRSSDSFGPFLVERSLTAGLLRGSLALSYQSASFDTIDGRSLTDGTLVATASRIRGDAQPFDVEAVSLDIHTNTVTLLGNIGVTDRLDIGAALPFVLPVSGRRRHLPGSDRPGDRVRLCIGTRRLPDSRKHNLLRRTGSGLAIGGSQVTHGQRAESPGYGRVLDRLASLLSRARPRCRPR
jgi:hypothetical protein